MYEQLRLESEGRFLRYKQIEQGFSNPNSYINEKVLNWMYCILRQQFEESQLLGNIDLLEMYCGCGNHTVALAPLFREVFAVELNSGLVDAANENFILNNITNARAFRCDSSKFAMKILKDRAFRWTARHSDSLASETSIDYDFKAVIVDPPRAGLDMKTIQAVSQYPYIIYISCNPDRLLENLMDVSL